MPCILPSGELNGISVPAICARHGGQWIDEPSLLTEPGIGNTMPPSMEYPGLIEPGVGNTFGPIGKSYSGGALQNPQKLNIMNNLDGAIGTSYPGSALQDPSKVMNAIGRDTDDFGNPLNANFAGDTNFGLLRDRAVNKFNTKPFNSNIFGRTGPFIPSDIPSMSVPGEAIPSSEIKRSPYQQLVTKSEELGGIAGDYVAENPITSVATLATGGPLIKYAGTKLLKFLGPLSKLVTTPQGILLTGAGTEQYFKNKEEVDAYVASLTDKTKGTLGVEKDTPPTTKTDTAKPTDRTNIFDWDAAGSPAAGSVDRDVYTSVKKKEPSLWENMQTEEYWFSPIEGGSGGWDNRLFRIGEMMSYMDTPLDARKDNPSKRWTDATTESAKIKAAIEKERRKAEGETKPSIFGKVSNTTMVKAIKEKVAKKMGKNQWTRLDPDDADVEQTSNEAVIAIQSLIDKGMSYSEAEKAVLNAIK